MKKILSYTIFLIFAFSNVVFANETNNSQELKTEQEVSSKTAISVTQEPTKNSNLEQDLNNETSVSEPNFSKIKSEEKQGGNNEEAILDESNNKSTEPTSIEETESNIKEVFYKETIENKTEEKPKPTYIFPKEALEEINEQIFRKDFIYISTIDPKIGDKGVGSSYPGLRGANQLVVYTPQYGVKTGTNEFGAEAVVIGNTIIKLSGADSLIPKNGFVISGHGSAKKWINENLRVGSKIYVNPDEKYIIAMITPQTYIFEANEKLKEIHQVINYYKMMDNSYDYKISAKYIDRVTKYLKRAEKNPKKVQPYAYEIKKNINKALLYAVPYKMNEFKGIWLRPTQKSPIEIQETVKKLKNAGINNIFLETYYHGVTIYPSEVLQKYGVSSQRNEFIGFDPLEVWISECHKNEIKLHTWFESFYIGNVPPRSSDKHILSVYPTWANTTKFLADTNEIAFSRAEHNGYFIDPANPEVQIFVLELIKEITEKYSPDGINLDYVRYPLGANVKKDTTTGTEWGYTRFARDEFMAQHEGVDPITLTATDPLKYDWNIYRENKITDFVSSVRKITQNKGIALTTVIFPDRQTTLDTKLQDWKTWSDYNLVDGFTPLILTTDRKTLNKILFDLKKELSSNTKLYAGLFPTFMNAHESELILQVHEARKMHADGVIIFDYAHFANRYINALNIRAFKNNKKD